MIASLKTPARIVATYHQLTVNPTQYAGKLKYGIQPIFVAGTGGKIVATIEPILEPLDFVSDSQKIPFRFFVRNLPHRVAAGRPLVLTYHGKLLGIFKPSN